MRDTFRPWPRPPRSRTPGASVTHRQGGTDHCWDRARSTEFQATPPPRRSGAKARSCPNPARREQRYGAEFGRERHRIAERTALVATADRDEALGRSRRSLWLFGLRAGLRLRRGRLGPRWRGLVLRRRRKLGRDERRRAQAGFLEQSRLEERLLLAQPGVKVGEFTRVHRRQRDEGAQIVVRWAR
jgi:hypothetical protein